MESTGGAFGIRSTRPGGSLSQGILTRGGADLGQGPFKGAMLSRPMVGQGGVGRPGGMVPLPTKGGGGVVQSPMKGGGAPPRNGGTPGMVPSPASNPVLRGPLKGSGGMDGTLNPIGGTNKGGNTRGGNLGGTSKGGNIRGGNLGGTSKGGNVTKSPRPMPMPIGGGSKRPLGSGLTAAPRKR